LLHSPVSPSLPGSQFQLQLRGQFLRSRLSSLPTSRLPTCRAKLTDGAPRISALIVSTYLLWFLDLVAQWIPFLLSPARQASSRWAFKSPSRLSSSIRVRKPMSRGHSRNSISSSRFSNTCRNTCRIANSNTTSSHYSAGLTTSSRNATHLSVS